jgi:PAS domain S-box-containing protein
VLANSGHMSDSEGQQRPRILFVEDEETVRDHLAQQLQREYIVDTASDGEQALRTVLRNRPDLIITDLVMPMLDGVELVKTLRNTPSTATIPILMISGRAPDELRFQGFEGGADSFLAKPYTERELTARIRSMLQSAQRRKDEARKQALEHAEQEAVKERAALLESISDAFYAVDRQWLVTYVNQRALDHFGKSREELLGHNLWDVLPVGKATRLEDEYKRVMRTRRPASFEAISPVTGRWLDIHAYPTPHGIAVNFRDITDRKRAEAALRDSELRFRSMANAVPVLMWRADSENRGIWFNQSWLDFTGRTLEAELGYGWSESIHPDDRERALSTRQACLRNFAPLEMELRLRRHDGEYRWMLDRGMPVFDDAGGEFSGYIGTCIDITDRKIAEEALRASEERYRRIVESADSFAIITTDEHGGINGWNVGAEKITGYLSSEALGQNVEFLLTTEDREARTFQQETRVASETGRAVNERWHIRKDGSRFWASGLLTTLESPRGGFLTIFRDRTAEYEAEAEVRRTEQRLRAAVIAAPYPIMLHAEDGEVLEISRKWLELTGYRRDQLRTHFDWFTLAYPPEDQARIRAMMAKEFESEGEIKVGELEVRTASGETRIWDFQNVGLGRLPDGRRLQISAAVDVTDRKKTEAALRARADEFHALADNIPTLCWMAYADGSIYWYNRRWYEYTGTSPDTQRGWGWESVHDPAVLPDVVERWKHSLATGEPFEMTFPLRGADGSFAPFLTRVVPIRNASGAVVRWFGTNTDVSAQLATEQQLRELTATLEQRVDAAVAERKSAIEQLFHVQKMETIGQLTGGVAHDFNNLLTPIVGALDILRRKIDDPRSQRLTTGALQAADRARTLVQRLLAFARKQHLEARSVDTRRLLESFTDLLRRTLGPQIEISTHAQSDLPPARVDPNQLELALLNLALNARDAMPNGGSLTITVQSQQIKRDPTLSDGMYVSIAVSDTGCGMDELTLKRAIEPFFTTKSTGQGTGLGLSMVHGLAAQSGGVLSLRSTAGQGTTATLILPVSDEQADYPPSGVTPDEEMRSNALTSVLLVDDEALVRASAAAMLADEGYKVVEASSASEAISLINGGLAPDAVVTDYAMPGMNGVQLARAIRGMQPGVPILMITGFANLSEEELGGLPRLSKPFRQKELGEAVAELLAAPPSQILG